MNFSMQSKANIIVNPKCPKCGHVFLGAFQGTIWNVCHWCKTEFTLSSEVDKEKK